MYISVVVTDSNEIGFCRDKQELLGQRVNYIYIYIYIHNYVYI